MEPHDFLSLCALPGEVPVIRGGATLGLLVLWCLPYVLLVKPSGERDSFWYRRQTGQREASKVAVWVGIVGAPAFLIGGLLSLVAPGFEWPAVVAVATLQIFVARSAYRRWQVMAFDVDFWDGQARIGSHGRHGSIRVLALGLAFVMMAALLIGLNEWARPT